MTVYLIGLSALTIFVGGIAQTIPELARLRPKNPVVRGVMGDTPALPLDQLVRGADAVVQGKVALVKTILTPDQMYILTEYQVVPEAVLASRAKGPTPNTVGASTLTLVVRRGSYAVDGFTVYDVDHTRQELKDGGRYVLFLRRANDGSDRYTLYSAGAFQLVDDDRLRPTLNGAEAAYKELVSRPAKEIRADIERLAKAGR